VASIVHCRPPGWAPQFALRFTHAPDNTVLPRDSFSPSRPAQHAVDTVQVRPQRLLTSRAHRLRKPHRTTRPLTPSVAGRALNRALHAPFSLPFGPALPGAGIAVVGLALRRFRHQDAFVGSIFDLAIEAGSHARSFTFARARLAPFSPTANRLPSSSRGPPRQADPG